MVVYIYPVETAFTQRDVEMLQADHQVRCLAFTQSPILLPFYFLIQFFQLLLLLPKTKTYLCFFGGYHTVLPVWFGSLFGIKVLIQAGGTDAVHMPIIGYGNFRKKWLKIATIYSFKNCTKIIPVADSLIAYDYTYDDKIETKQGLKNLIPELKTPIEVVYNGFDVDFWKDFNRDRIPNSFITVAKGISNPTRANIKGIDLIDKLALAFPEFHFSILGDANYISKAENIHILPASDPEQLRKILNQHVFYLQLSTSEGFPNALAEAMLCGCIPIGSAVGDIPSIIGNTGGILAKKEFSTLEALILKLSHSNDLEAKRIQARNRIADNYSYQKRKSALLNLINYK
jgi:glycosyltransferase involved in cell wall biosynthesis